MSFDRLARLVARRVDQDTAGRGAGSFPASDPFLASWLGRLSGEANMPRIESGVVVDVAPGGYCYKVGAGSRAYLWCSPGGATGGIGAYGQRPIVSYPVGTTVYFIRHPQTPSVGTIVAAEPQYLNPVPAARPADGVWPFVRSGQLEPAHRWPIEASENLALLSGETLGGVDWADFSGGRPLDSTAVGETGSMAETGVGTFADPFQVYMRVDEATGVFGFYDDQLLRVAGVNYQQFTSLSETEHLVDEAELYGMTRKYAYPWELAGLWRYNQITVGVTVPPVPNHGLSAGQGTAVNDPVAVQAGDGTAVREPEYATQIGAARGYVWEGYLGQGGKELWAAPVQLNPSYPGLPENARTVGVDREDVEDAPNGQIGPVVGFGDDPVTAEAYVVPPNTRDGGKDQPGVYEEQKTYTGGVHIRTNRRYIVTKRSVIPTPRQVKRPEDPYGDAKYPEEDHGGTPYASSGLTGNTVAHKVLGELEPTEGPAQRMCMLPDVLAYAFNWEGLHPFAYHERDWYVAEEGTAGKTLINQAVPDYSELEDTDVLDVPGEAQFLDVDHRYGLVNLYETESVFAMLDDGSIVLEDGWGSSIRMGGGNLELHAPGDIRIFNGRNTVVWAGHDFTTKAHNSVDFAAVNGDVRTAAARNSHHLAGNAGCGGFLFEAKAECAAYNYPGKVGQEVVSSGFVVLTPRSQFLVRAGDVAVQLSGEGLENSKIAIDAGVDEDEGGGEVHIRGLSQTHVVAADRSIIQAFVGGANPTFAEGADAANEFTAGYNLFGGNVYVRGTVSAEESVAQQVTNPGMALRADYLTDEYGVDLREATYPAPGDVDIEFTLRTAYQYRAESFTYWRPKWQSLVAFGGGSLVAWEEDKVVGSQGGAETRPHPGMRWEEDDSFKYVVPKLVNTEGWLAKPRGANKSDYEDYETDDPGQGSLQARFTIPFTAGP